MEVINLILPVFAVVVTGYLFARLNVLPESVGGTLIQFVYYVAIPALLFVVIAQERIDSLLNWPFIAAYGGVVAAVFLIILIGSMLSRKMALASATMLATICVGSNTAIIGLPLLHSLFGHKIIVLSAITNVIVVALFLVQVLILEASGPNDSESDGSKLAHIKNAVLNPIILSVILGVAYAITPLSLPKLVTDYLELLGAALTPCALFAIGMSIKPAEVLKSGATIVFASTVKLLVVPILVFAAARMIGLDPLMTIVAVVAAAVPTAKSEFILAKQYHQSEDLVAGTISLTTAISIISLIVWLVVLSYVYPGEFSFR
ncbi:MAG: AEC family transporter [Alphaproteobacteria bacterium]|nr:AEC family transporter [Alphaproteobacteria bacterium]